MTAYSMVYYHATDVSAVATDSDMRRFCLNEDRECRRHMIAAYLTPNSTPPVNSSTTCCDVCNDKQPQPRSLPWKQLHSVSDEQLAKVNLNHDSTRNVTDE